MKRSKLKALIVDDQLEARELLHAFLKKNNAIGEIREANSIEEALFQYIDFAPDIIFLDIIMPGRNGIDLIELVNKKDINCTIVIISGHEEAAINAIQNNIYDFILKPVNVDKLNTVIKKYYLRKNTSFEEKLNKVLTNIKQDIRIKLTSPTSHFLVSPKDIIYCEAKGAYSTIYFENGNREVVYIYLGKLEKLLTDYHFLRINRSLLINLDKLSEVNKGDNSCILTADKKEVKLYGSKMQMKILCEMNFE